MKFYNKELSDIENFVGAQFDNSKVESDIRKTKIFNITRINLTRHAVSIVALIILFVALIVTSKLSESEYYKLASIKELTDISGTRGRITNEYELSIKAIENKDYKSAIIYLKKDIELNKNDETIFYSHYLLGLTYLETAEKSFLGLFPKFDKVSAEEAIKNFKLAIELNNTGRFQNINLDAYFYAGKAALMLEDTKAAKEFFQIVINEKGSKFNEASEILKILN